jgi:hypothetical protein
MPGATTRRQRKALVKPLSDIGGNSLERAQHEQSGLDQLPQFLRNSLRKVGNASLALMPSLNC